MRPSRRAPVLTINANQVDPRRPPSGRKRDIGAIVGGTIGGVAVIFAVIGVLIFVQRRRRWVRPKSILSSPTDSLELEVGPHATVVTPSDPNLDSPEGIRDAGISAEQEPSVDEDPDTETVAPHRPRPLSSSSFESSPRSLSSSSSPPAVLPLQQPVEPVPVGLSDKEIARLRAQTLGFQQSQTRLNVSQPETRSSANAATGEHREASSSYDATRRLRSEVESLRREMERLRELERLRAEAVTEAPPSYTEGD